MKHGVYKVKINYVIRKCALLVYVVSPMNLDTH